MPNAPKPVASLSLDLDNLWSYMKTHGDAGWQSRPTYLPRVVPVALELLESLKLAITFFVVGVDADRDENGAALRSIVEAGHEIGNHSYEHEPWLHRYSHGALEEEIDKAEDAIVRCVGQRPRGFRGPGFSHSAELLDVLAHRGYRFDASTFPTVLGPLARLYYFAAAKLTPAQREERAALFGSWSAALWPNEPYEWALPSGRRLLEIPVTVCPFVRTPFHLSYVLYLAGYSERTALAYWRSALAICRLAGVAPSVLLHPLDFIDASITPQLRFFPGMNVPGDAKRRLLRTALGILREQYDVVPMSLHAQRLAASSLPLRRAAADPPAPLHPSAAPRT
ncbi:MAG TPA: polysaccharide deacetylase family protein [Gemmatimonadaceae bacterium]|jgi:peptidoglycan/xylan/chitin deacetylase (PgdA/CDA1 family)